MLLLQEEVQNEVIVPGCGVKVIVQSSVENKSGFD